MKTRHTTVESILEKVIGNRIRRGDILPLPEDIDKRETMTLREKLQIVVIDSNSQKNSRKLEKTVGTDELMTPKCRFSFSLFYKHKRLKKFSLTKQLNQNYKEVGGYESIAAGHHENFPWKDGGGDGT